MAVVVNIVGGPGVGKSTLFHRIAGDILRYHPEITIAVLHEEVKIHVWLGEFKKLKKQKKLSKRKAKIIKKMSKKAQLVLVDGSLIGDAYYARHYQENTSNIEKTVNFIRRKFAGQNNFLIHLSRGNLPYEEKGRYQTFEQARDVDYKISDMLDEFQIEHRNVTSSQDGTYNGEYDALLEEIVAQAN